MRGRVGRRKCQTSAGSKSFAIENEGRECAFSALRQPSGVPRAEARKKSRHLAILLVVGEARGGYGDPEKRQTNRTKAIHTR